MSFSIVTTTADGTRSKGTGNKMPISDYETLFTIAERVRIFKIKL
jgi:hypothetical protein